MQPTPPRAPLLLLLLLLALAAAAAARPEPAPVRTEAGLVRGTYMTSAKGRRFAAFRGVPYARPPLGDLRFREPQPVPAWPGEWSAREYGSPCLQYDFTFTPEQERVIGDEDCLFVNVFSPQLPEPDSAKPKPRLSVIVYIHGGVFMHGTGNLYGPKLLMDHDVVLVTLNYRLGALGFLSTEDQEVPGNNGLKDQAFALRWVQRNIAAFGGDPGSVTISGTSAGGASVHYHYLSPLSRGLFHKGMSFSGSTLLPWALAYEHQAKAQRLAELLGCPTADSHHLVACLRQRPARLIAWQTRHFQVWRFNPFNPFGPIFPEPGNTPFLSRQPVETILKGEAQDLPWLTSITTAEGIYPAGEYAAKEDALQEINSRFSEIIPHILHFNYSVANNEMKTVSDQIRKFYFQEKPISSQTRKELIQMIGDRIFVVDIERAARLMADSNSSPVYFYEFSYRGADSISNFMSKTKIDMGVAHGDDTAYILHSTFMNTESTKEDRSVSELMLNMCVNFARTGNPTITGTNVDWVPVQPRKKEIDYFSIGSSTNLEMRASLDLGNRKFWDNLPIKEPQIIATKKKYISDEL